jgi:hypothetical protein
MTCGKGLIMQSDRITYQLDIQPITVPDERCSCVWIMVAGAVRGYCPSDTCPQHVLVQTCVPGTAWHQP